MQIKKELYMPSPRAGHAVNIGHRYMKNTGLQRMETRAYECEGRDDLPLEPHVRYSADNGQNWSTWRRQPDVVAFYDDYITVGAMPGDNEPPPFSHTFEDPSTGFLLSIEHRQTIHLANNRRYHNHCFWRFSKDGGKQWSKYELLTYEKGADFDPSQPLNPDFLVNNSCYPGNCITHIDGSIIFTGTSVNIPKGAPDTDPEGRFGNWWSPSHARDIGCGLFRVVYDEKKDTYVFTYGGCMWVPMSVSCRGLDEGFSTLLNSGELLTVCRGSNTDVTTGHKWFGTTKPGDIELGPVQKFCYDTGDCFYSPASIHGFLRHSVNQKLYWVANIVKDPPMGNSPRYPLVICEIDEEKPAVKKDTVTVLADRQAHESDEIQWSNFSLLEDRQTHHIELYMTPIGTKARHRDNPDLFWETGCYRFTLRP